jgi:hypothetical protein
MKKPTVATLKSFIRKNEGKILINVKSSFDGMTDSVESLSGGFRPLEKKNQKQIFVTDHNSNPTLGYKGVWLVGCSRDHVKPFSEDGLRGFDVHNSCGRWIVAIRKAAENG